MMIRAFASKHCIARHAVQPGFKLRELHTSTVVNGFGSHASGEAIHQQECIEAIPVLTLASEDQRFYCGADNDPEVLEAEKRKNLSGQTKSSMPGHASG